MKYGIRSGFRQAGDSPEPLGLGGSRPAVYIYRNECHALVVTQAETGCISAVNVLESGIVLEARRGEGAGREFDLFLHHAQFEVVRADSEQVEIARVAWRKYAKGRHPAGLNFGDCFAYALAKVLGEPILFKGDDFRHTDLAAAIR
jgi:ribonuclease VapC